MWVALGVAVVIVIIAVVWCRAAPKHLPANAPADSPSASVLGEVDPEGTAKIDLFSFRGETVLLVSPAGSDHFNNAFRLNGEFLGAPSGGIIGHGDGSLPDWRDSARFLRRLRGPHYRRATA